MWMAPRGSFVPRLPKIENRIYLLLRCTLDHQFDLVHEVLEKSTEGLVYTIYDILII